MVPAQVEVVSALGKVFAALVEVIRALGELVPALVVAAAEQTEVLAHAAAVVDGGQVVADGADVREVDVLLDDALAAAHQRRPVLTTRHCAEQQYC